MPIPIREILWKLTLKPDINSKHLIILLILRREEELLRLKLSVSFVNCKYEMRNESTPTVNIPWIRPRWQPFISISLNSSILMLKRKRDMESPCIKPLVIENSFVGKPFTRTKTLAVGRHWEIHSFNRSPNPIQDRNSSK